MNKPLRLSLAEERQCASLIQPALGDLAQFLAEWIPTQPHPMRLKNARTGRFMQVNAAAAELDGLQPEAHLGLTMEDRAQCHAFNTPAIEVHRQYDAQVCRKQCSVSFPQVWLNAQGLIRFETIYKAPVFATDHSVAAILESSHDRTLSGGLEPLFSHYEQAYPIRQAIQYLLTHVDLERAFYRLPTRRELMTLLSLCHRPTAKQVAAWLKISERTVEEYKARLHCKLNSISLQELLVKLRCFH